MIRGIVANYTEAEITLGRIVALNELYRAYACGDTTFLAWCMETDQNTASRFLRLQVEKRENPALVFLDKTFLDKILYCSLW